MSSPLTFQASVVPAASLLAIALAGALAATLPTPLPRRLTALGLLALAFGLSSAGIARGNNPMPGGPGSLSLAIDAGFVVAGFVLLAWGGMRARGAGLVLVVLAMLLGWLNRGLILSAGVGAAGVAGAIMLTGLAAGAGVGAAMLRRRRARPTTVLQQSWPPHTRNRRVLAAVGAVLAIAGPTVWLVIGGALLAAGAVSFVVLAIAAAGLLPALWFLWTVAGPVGLRTAELGSVPLSAAAEPLLAAALALGAVALFPLWPLRRWASPFLVPVGVAVLLRLGPAVPAGLQSWQTVLVPLGVIALLHALVTADPLEAIAAGAWLAAVTGGSTGAILLAAGVVLPGVEAAATRMRSAAFAWFRAPAWAVTAVGGALALQSLLGAEVVYGVLSAAAVAGLIARMEWSPA